MVAGSRLTTRNPDNRLGWQLGWKREVVVKRRDKILRFLYLRTLPDECPRLERSLRSTNFR